MRFDLLTRNVSGREGQGAPKVITDEVEIIPREQINDVVDKLRRHAIYDKAVIALFTGLRRGELLALRWGNIDLEAKLIAVREVLQETKGG